MLQLITGVLQVLPQGMAQARLRLCQRGLLALHGVAALLRQLHFGVV